MFSRVYIWSPSIEIDSTWEPVKDYIRDHTKPNYRETYYFDSYDPSELEQVLKTQQKVIYFKKENIKVCIRYSLLSVILPMTPFLHENHNFYINFTLGEDIT